MADGGNQMHITTTHAWRQREKQLEKVVQVQAYIRRRMLAPGHLVVEMNGKQFGVSQEE